jgi:hypothetical protein
MVIKQFRRDRIEKTNNKKDYIRREKMVQLKCDICGNIHERTLRHYKKMKKYELFDKDYCNLCWRPILNNRPDKIEKMKLGLKEFWKSEEKRKEMSEIIKRVKDISGDKNPMKNLETRKKVGKTRSEKMTEEERKKYSEGSKRAWAEGKFIGVNNTWKCLWYDYKHSNGKIYKVQGTWELKFIEWLDEKNIKFECHKGRLPYLHDNIEKNYYPDFFVYDWNCYVDIKSNYVYDKQKDKFVSILNKYNNVKILFKKDLNKLGIKV